jgi:hypothetical protein
MIKWLYFTLIFICFSVFGAQLDEIDAAKSTDILLINLYTNSTFISKRINVDNFVKSAIENRDPISINNLVISNGITLGGVTRTDWPTNSTGGSSTNYYKVAFGQGLTGSTNDSILLYSVEVNTNIIATLTAATNIASLVTNGLSLIIYTGNASNLTGTIAIERFPYTPQPASANLTNWSSLATSAKQDTLGYTPATNTYAGISNSVKFVIATNLGYALQPSSANLSNWSSLATSAKQDTLGYAPQYGSANLSNWSSLATSAKQDALGYTPATNSNPGIISALGYTPAMNGTNTSDTNYFLLKTNGIAYHTTTRKILDLSNANFYDTWGNNSLSTSNRVLYGLLGSYGDSADVRVAIDYGNWWLENTNGTIVGYWGGPFPIFYRGLDIPGSTLQEGSLRLGAGAEAMSVGSIAIGYNTVAGPTNGAIAIGTEAGATGNDSISLGSMTSASKWDATAIGAGASAAHTGSTALGALAGTTADRQLMLGTSSDTVYAPNNVQIIGFLYANLLNATNLPVAGISASGIAANKYLKGDGTWDNPSSGAATNVIDITSTYGINIVTNGLLRTLSLLVTNPQLGTLNLSNWSSLAPPSKQDALGYTPATNTYDGISNSVKFLIATNLGFIPQLGSQNLTNWSAIGTSSKQDTLGYTPQPSSANLTSWSSIAPSTKQDTILNKTNAISVNTAFTGEGGLLFLMNFTDGQGVYASKYSGSGAGLTSIPLSAMATAVQPSNANLTAWSLLPTSSKQYALGYVPATNTYAGISNSVKFLIATNLGYPLQLGSQNLTNWSALPASFTGVTNALGYYPATNGQATLGDLISGNHVFEGTNYIGTNSTYGSIQLFDVGSGSYYALTAFQNKIISDTAIEIVGAPGFIGDGQNLIDLNAAELFGTIPSDVLPNPLPAISGNSLTNINPQNVVYYTNLSDNGVVDISKSFSAISTNNNIKFNGISGIDESGTIVQRAEIVFTNTSASGKTITYPASWICTDNPINITKQGVLRITVYPGMGTNADWIDWK